MARGYSLEILYPLTADRPAFCANCVHDQTPRTGIDTHAWCGVTDEQHPANHECAIGRYEERVQSDDELLHLAEVSKGSAFARLSKQLLAAAAEGTRELVEVQPGLVMSPTPGKRVARATYDDNNKRGDAA